MSLLTIQNLSLSFVGRTIFHQVGFQVAAGDRVGLIGPNGSGKTSMLRILAGRLAPDGGEVTSPKNVQLGYLPQDVQESLSGPLLPVVLDAVPGRRALREELERAEVAMEEAVGDEAQIAAGIRLGELHSEAADLDTRYPPHEAEVILQGLGFKAGEMQRDLSELSGGWKTRAALAGLLYRRPDVLLLDEPTNHLDIPSVRWLEGFLQTFPGAIVLICHDRDFLNRQVNRILSLEPEGLRAYSGNYDFYLKAREEERAILESQRRTQDRKVADAKKFIDRFRAKASKARQAQSKIKLLEKMEMVEGHESRKVIRFRFGDVERSGRHVVQLEGIGKRFGERVLYRDLDLSIERGERIAVIGENGAGKTTLLRIIAGDLNPDGGKVKFGHKVSMSYYAQHQADALSPERSVVEEVLATAPGLSQTAVRSVCGAFLFAGDDVEKLVGVLSGGEKARVALAKLLVTKANLLVMDEPTNHLDLDSTEKLVDALSDFQGTVLFVSHNQGFLNRLATRIWDVRGGEVHQYPGGLYEYYDFLARQQAQAGAAAAPAKPARVAAPVRAAAPAEDAASRKDQRRQRAGDRAEANRVLRPLERRVQDLEARIQKLEARELALSAELADPALYSDKERSLPLLTEHGELRRKLGELMSRWEHAQEEFDRAKARFLESTS